MNQTKKRVKLGKPGRPRKLSPAELRRGVEAYFASISYLEPVEREEYVVLETDPRTGAVSYQLDKMGHKMVRKVPVCDGAGKQLTRLCYTTPPGDFGLCDFLKISRDTWERYGKAVELLEERRRKEGDGSFGSVQDDRNGDRSEDGGPLPPGGARAAPTEEDPEMEEAREYAAIYALARGRVCAYLESAAEGKGGKGAQFKLERIYGLSEQKEVTVSAGGGVEEYLRALGGEAEY